VTRARALDFFKYHTSTVYTLAFQAVCIEQILRLARSLKEVVPLAQEAYPEAYSGYWATSVGALIRAMEGSLTRIVSDLGTKATASDKIDHAVNRAIETAARLRFDHIWVPPEYKICDYLFGQDERVFAFETFRRWLKNHFFCNTDEYPGGDLAESAHVCKRHRGVMAVTGEFRSDGGRACDTCGHRILVRCLS